MGTDASGQTRVLPLRWASAPQPCVVETLDQAGRAEVLFTKLPESPVQRDDASDATPLTWAAVMKACRSVCGPMGLAIPARRATRRTICPAPCRSSRFPSAMRKIGPSQRSPMARSIARAVRGASGIVTLLPPLRTIARVRCRGAPRSTPKACSVAGPSPRRPVARPLRCGPGAGCVRLVIQARSADMDGRGVIQQLFLRVLVEPGDGAQPEDDSGAGSSFGFKVAAEALDVRAPDFEQTQRVRGAPGGEPAEVSS